MLLEGARHLLRRSYTSLPGLVARRQAPSRKMTSTRHTPVLDCREYAGILIQPTADCSTGNNAIAGPSRSASGGNYKIHRLDRPSFNVPPSLVTHVRTAAAHLRAGRCVAIPTETVYGLAASSLDPEACKLIYRIKNRPSDNPLIMHVSSLDMLRRLLPPPAAYTPSRLYMALIDAFWPGPLTLLFPSPDPPPRPAPQTNGIRMPLHPLALAVIHEADTPVSAPSANSSGRPSPTRAEHVVHDIGGAEGLGCILDGGDCGVGVESTVVDALGWKEGGGGDVDVLRPGGLGVEAIARVVAEVDGREGMTRILVHGKPWRASGDLAIPKAVAGTSDGHAGGMGPVTPPQAVPKAVQDVLHPSTPGMKYRHYSPRIPVYLALPSTTFPSPNIEIGTCTTTPAHLLQLLVSAHTASLWDRPVRIGLLHYADSPLAAAMRATTATATISTTSAAPIRRTTPASGPATALEITYKSLGPDATSAAQLLFSSMLDMERNRLVLPNNDAHTAAEAAEGVDAIIIEGCTEEGLGLAVMERVRKAVGGGGILGDVADGQGSKEQGVFWVNLGV